eukprot:gnl/MRDRNA2_/MRDRNA2_86411_c0_seq1.p1 gnl/MRDRNA2_/MRDRNA2_86411_c0~~gnl/MRDRNA2_/MRDRNA2_86411_c0_seq1.p1  ORF type:complete len:556 (+),score=115.30 gnl/MRDRNA2_/MRDRNA2_86411_c0_seq1:471-2138(+)
MYANLQRANIGFSHWEGACLDRANLQNSIGDDRTHLECAHFIHANLESVAFRNVHLERTDFKGARLQDASLTGAHLERASLIQTNLQGASLELAHLEGADFERANLTNTRFKGASTSPDTNFSDAYTTKPLKPIPDMQGKTMLGGICEMMIESVKEAFFGDDDDDNAKDNDHDDKDKEDDEDKDTQERKQDVRQMPCWKRILQQGYSKVLTAAENTAEHAADTAAANAQSAVEEIISKNAEKIDVKITEAILAQQKVLEEKLKGIKGPASQDLQNTFWLLTKDLPQKDQNETKVINSELFMKRLQAFKALLTLKAETPAEVQDALKQCKQGLTPEDIQKVFQRNMADEFKKTTGMSPGGTIKTIKQVCMLKAIQINMDIDDLKKILESIKELQASVTKSSWDDYLDTVMALYEMAPTLQGEGARRVLKVVFENETLRHELALAMQFHNIKNPEDVPTDILQRVKWCAGHIKKNARQFEKRVEREIAAANRILSYKEKATGLLATLLISAGVAIGNFGSRVFEKYLEANGDLQFMPYAGSNSTAASTFLSVNHTMM